MRLWTDTEAGNLRLTSDNGLSPVHLRAIALLEGAKPLKDIAAEMGLTPDAFREMRRKREFVDEYRKQLAHLEQEAFDLPIARKVERVKALNDQWVKLKVRLERYGPRSDLVYTLIALQTAAAKELGQDIQRVELGGRLEIQQAVTVIRFEAQQRNEALEAHVVEGEFSEIPELPAPTEDEQFKAALANVGVRIQLGTAQPEELTAIRRAISERALDAREVLTDDQYRRIYGREKQDDLWG